MCVRVFREAGYEGEAGNAAQTVQENMLYLHTVRRKKDLYKMRLCTARTIHERVRKLVITPHHTAPSLIPTMRDVAQVFASRK